MCTYLSKLQYLLYDDLHKLVEQEEIGICPRVMQLVQKEDLNLCMAEEGRELLHIFAQHIGDIIKAVDPDKLDIEQKITDVIKQWATIENFKRTCCKTDVLNIKEKKVGAATSSAANEKFFSDVADLENVKKTLFNYTQKELGEELGKKIEASISKQIKCDIMKQVSDEFLKLNLAPSKNTYQEWIIEIYQRKVDEAFASAFGIIIEKCIEFLHNLLTLPMRFYKKAVDICSTEWRGKVAQELYDKFRRRKPKFHKDFVRQAQCVICGHTDRDRDP